MHRIIGYGINIIYKKKKRGGKSDPKSQLPHQPGNLTGQLYFEIILHDKLHLS